MSVTEEARDAVTDVVVEGPKIGSPDGAGAQAVGAPAGKGEEAVRNGSGTEHTVGRVEDVPPGEGRAFVAGEVQIAVFRLRDGSLHATQASCPHSGGPLADGQTDANLLVCPLHLFAFRWEDGSCAGDAGAMRLYDVRESDGELVVTV